MMVTMMRSLGGRAGGTAMKAMAWSVVNGYSAPIAVKEAATATATATATAAGQRCKGTYPHSSPVQALKPYRLVAHFSNKYCYAQVIDSPRGENRILTSASTIEKTLR